MESKTENQVSAVTSEPKLAHDIEIERFSGDYRLRFVQVFSADGKLGLGAEYGVRPFDEILGVSIPEDPEA